MKFLGMSIGVQVIVWFIVLAIATFSEHLRNPLLSDRVIRLFMFFLGIGTGIGLVTVLI